MMYSFGLVFLLIAGVKTQSTSVCSQTSDVTLASGLYEKSMCFVRQRLTRSAAKNFCTSKGMSLFERSSTPAANNQVGTFIRSLGLNSALGAYVDGLLSGKCVIINSLGKPAGVSCTATYFFVCEFQKIINSLLPKPGQCGVIVENRIFGGARTTLEEQPWMTLLQYKAAPNRTDHLCGGALINSRYVLTAAHCVNGDEMPKGWSLTGVRLGEWDLTTEIDCIGDYCNNPPVDVPIEQKIPHPQYSASSLDQNNDIALLRLVREVSFSEFIQPICLPLEPALRNLNYVNKELTVCGWGYTETGSRSSIKLDVDVNGVSNIDCNGVYGNIIDTKLCAGGKKGLDSCYGDSGGPLMIQNTQSVINYTYIVGVVSYGMECGVQGIPGVYTRVGSFMNWIQANIKA